MSSLVASISSRFTPLTTAMFNLKRMEPSFADDFQQVHLDLIHAQAVLAGMSKRKIRLIEPHLTKLTVLMLAALARLQSKALSVEEYAALLKPVQELNKIVRPAARPAVRLPRPSGLLHKGVLPDFPWVVNAR